MDWSPIATEPLEAHRNRPSLQQKKIAVIFAFISQRHPVCGCSYRLRLSNARTRRAVIVHRTMVRCGPGDPLSGEINCTAWSQYVHLVTPRLIALFVRVHSMWVWDGLREKDHRSTLRLVQIIKTNVKKRYDLWSRKKWKILHYWRCASLC